MKTRLLKRLRRKAYKQVKLKYQYDWYCIEWQGLRYNISKHNFLFKDYSQLFSRPKATTWLFNKLWEARERAVMYMFEEYKEKIVNRKMNKV